MLALGGVQATLAQMARQASACLVLPRGLLALAQGHVRSFFRATSRRFAGNGRVPGCNQRECHPEDGAAPAGSETLSSVARIFIGEAESHFMACHRQQITAPQCAVRLEKTLQDIVGFARRLEKSRSHKDCNCVELDRLIGEAGSAKQSVLRLLRWIENDGLAVRVLPPCGGRGSHAHFATREADGSLRWIGLLNWSFDGIAVEGFAHAERRPVRLATTDIADWLRMDIGTRGSDHDRKWLVAGLRHVRDLGGRADGLPDLRDTAS